MSCGCAKRARIIFEKMGYRKDEESDDWISPKGDRVPDDEIENHHARETTKLLLKKLSGRV